MSVHYLIDAHTNPVLNSDINDVRIATTSSPLNGNFVIRIPDGVRLASNPTSFSDLLSKKITGLIERYPGFSTGIAYSHLLDASSMGVPGDSGVRSSRCGCIFSGAFDIETVTQVIGAPISRALVLAEFFSLTMSNPKASRLTLTYSEVEHTIVSGVHTPVRVDASNDGGSTYVNGVSLGQAVNFAAPDTDLKLKFSFGGGSGAPFGLGFWAILY